MTRIRLYDQPFAPAKPQEFTAPSIGEWLLEHFGESPQVTLHIYRGEPCAENEVTGDVSALLANDGAEYVVLQSPGFDPASWTLAGFLQSLAVSTALSVVSMLLTPTPSMPANVNRTQSSPNNSLGNRENQVRLLQRIEDIYGTVKAIPSLMMPTYIKYIQHQKFEHGYYCVGRGYYSVAEIRDGDTLLSEIDGASAAVYNPFTSPNSGSPIIQIGDPIIDKILTAKRAIEVDGVTLKAFNQVQLPTVASYRFTPNTITQIDGPSGKAKRPNFNSVANVGQSVTISGPTTRVVSATEEFQVTATAADGSIVSSDSSLFSHVVVGDAMTISGFTGTGEFGDPISNDGVFTVTALVPGGFVVAQPISDLSTNSASFSVVRNYNGTYVIDGVGDGVITVVGAPFVGTLNRDGMAIQLVGVTHMTDWSTLPTADRSEVWCNVVALGGMFKDDGGRSVATVGFTIEIEKLDAHLNPTGIVETVTGSLSGSVSDERADTVEHATAWVGPCRVRMYRTTPYDYDFEGTVIDEIKWADLYSISPVSQAEFGNKTTIHTITQATARATAVKTRQLNCLASRLLPTYDGSAFSGAFDASGRHVSGAIHPTSKLVDIIAAVAVDPKIGRRDLATEVDMAQIWGVQQQLDAWNPECGQFNFTFDTDNTSFEETVIMIANAGFCIAYRQNGKIRLALDRLQANSTALFTHRNKKPNAETITRRFANDAEYDGVEFVYVDPDSNQSETIVLPLDGNYTKAKKYEIAGIRSFAQAWLRANREYQKLIGQRISIETSTTADARSLLPNSRIDVVDNTRFRSYDGEVVGQDGMEITLSRDVEFSPGLAHSIVLMRRDGSLQSISCTPGSASNRVVLQAAPTEEIVTSYGQDGIRTIFSFAADSARGAMAYLVQEIDLSDKEYPVIRAINYSPDYYAADYAAIPPKQSVIS